VTTARYRQITGAVRRDGSQLMVNPWFAWMLIGGIVSFLVALMIRGHALNHPDILEVATAAAGGWIGAVILVWIAVRVFGQRSLGAVGGAPVSVQGGHFVSGSSDLQRSRLFLGGGILFAAGILIGGAFGSRGSWTSTDTTLVLVGAGAVWQGIAMLGRASRD
jgi:hypothetical protein